MIAVNVIEVPRQTSLSQDLTFEEERVERQQELLDSARDIAEDLDVGLRTRAILGRSAGSVILDVIEEESADHVLRGWEETRSRREHVLGSTIDPVIARGPEESPMSIREAIRRWLLTALNRKPEPERRWNRTGGRPPVFLSTGSRFGNAYTRSSCTVGQ